MRNVGTTEDFQLSLLLAGTVDVAVVASGDGYCSSGYFGHFHPHWYCVVDTYPTYRFSSSASSRNCRAEDSFDVADDGGSGCCCTREKVRWCCSSSSYSQTWPLPLRERFDENNRDAGWC